MIAQALRPTRFLFGTALAILGCGSGGATTTNDGSANCTGSLTPGATMSWQDDGAAQCATEVSATYAAGAASSIFEIVGSETSGVAISIGASATAAGTAIEG